MNPSKMTNEQLADAIDENCAVAMLNLTFEPPAIAEAREAARRLRDAATVQDGKRVYGTGHVPDNWHVHAGPPSQPLATPLTADGVPMYNGMVCYDYNGQQFHIQEVWSEAYNDHGKTRVMVGVFPDCCWGNLFSTKESASKAVENG